MTALLSVLIGVNLSYIAVALLLRYEQRKLNDQFWAIHQQNQEVMQRIQLDLVAVTTMVNELNSMQGEQDN